MGVIGRADGLFQLRCRTLGGGGGHAKKERGRSWKGEKKVTKVIWGGFALVASFSSGGGGDRLHEKVRADREKEYVGASRLTSKNAGRARAFKG